MPPPRGLFIPKRNEANVTEVGETNYIEYSFQKREALKSDNDFIAHVHFLWDIIGKDSNGHILQDHYVELFYRIAFSFILNSSIDSAQQLVHRDWEYDSRGRTYMLYNDFVDAIFEICDLFCPFTDTHEYCVLLMDVRRLVVLQDIQEGILEGSLPEHHAILKECLPYRWRTPEELKKVQRKEIAMGTSDMETVLLNRNGEWITSYTLLHEHRELSFKHTLAAMHQKLYGSFSQKLQSVSKGLQESEYRLHQAKQGPPVIGMPSRSESTHVLLIPPPRPSASALRISYMTNHIRNEPWSAEVANIVQAIGPRPVICVVGPPRSGKTRLAQSLARELGLRYYSLPLALEEAAFISRVAQQADKCISPSTLNVQIASMLRSGQSIPRELAIEALLHYMAGTLHGTQGCILDDIYPHDAWGSDAFAGIQFTHVVCLQGTLSNCSENCSSMSMCPKSRRIYSARDLALGMDGYADEYEEALENTFPSSGNDAPLVSQSNSNVIREDEGGDDSVEDAQETGNEPIEKINNTDDNAIYRIPRMDLEYMAKNHVWQPPQEQLLTIEAINQAILDLDYGTFEKGLAKTIATAPPELQLVRILFHQSPLGVLQEALVALSGTFHPAMSRLPTSLVPVPIELPPDVAALSRGQQIRWLLYSDWTEFVQDGGPLARWNPFLLPTEMRRLSVLRGFCPVERGGVLGLPTFAVLFSGRIYMMSNASTHQQFLQQPHRYLESLVNPLNQIVLPPTPVPSRVWIVTSQAEWTISSFTLSSLSSCIFKAWRTTPLDPLAILNEPSAADILRSGVSITHSKMALNVLQAVKSKGLERWIVHSIPSSEDTWKAMQSEQVLPECVIILELPPTTEGGSEASGSVNTLLTSIATTAPHIKLIKCPVQQETTQDDVFVTIHRQIDPYYFNRIDGEDDGFSPDQPALSPIEEGTRSSYGIFGIYCPVTFASSSLWRLVPGKKEHQSFVDQQLYTFAGQAEKAAFDWNPWKYLPTSALTSFRPTILLLGPRLSGRRSLAVSLANTLGGTVFDFDRVLSAFRKRISIEAFNTEVDELEEDAKAQIYCGCLEKEWERVDKSGSAPYIIPGFGLTDQRQLSLSLLTLCLERKWCPFVVVPLKLEAPELVDRAMKGWEYKPSKDDGEVEETESTPAERKERLAAAIAAAQSEELARVTDIVNSDLESWTAVMEYLSEQGIAMTEPIDGTRGPQRILKLVLHALQAKGLDRRRNFFCQPQKLTFERMKALTCAGHLTVSHHGPYCPVTKKIFKNEQSEDQICVAYRDRVYFPSDFNAFCANPLQYASCRTQPNVPTLSCVVIGAPGSGKTSVAKGLSKLLGWKYLTKENIILWTLHCQRGTTTWTTLQSMKDHTEISDSLFLQCMVNRVRAFDCQVHGWVLDGYPLTLAQMVQWEQLQDPSTLPSALICLDSSIYTTMQHLQLTSPPINLIQSTQNWLASRQALLISLLQSYGSGFVKLVSTGFKSKWKVLAEVEALVLKMIEANSAYFQALASHGAGHAYDVRLSTEQVQIHPNIKTNCPVSLCLNQTSPSHSCERELLVEFQNYSYYLGSSAHLAAFLANPTNVLENTKIQSSSACDVGIGSALCHGMRISLGFQGYCPVTYKDGQGPSDWQSIRKGNKYILAAFNQTVYTFVSEAAKRRFLLEPSLFSRLELPTKLPPLVDDTQRELNLKLPGKLEQAMSKITEEALVSLGGERLKFPCVNSKASAIMYIALFLKSKKKFSNQSESPRIIQTLLQEYVQDCRLGQNIKELTAPVGSAVKGVRSMREKGESIELDSINQRFDFIINAPDVVFKSYSTRGPIRDGYFRFHWGHFHSTMLVTETTTDITTSTTPMRLHWFTPTLLLDPANAQTKLTSVLVFTEIYQVTGPVERFCRQIAAQGFIVASCESYHNFLAPGTVLAYDVPGTDLGNQLKKDKRLSSYDDDASHAISALLAHPNSNGRVGVTGMCLGGHLAFRAAMDPRVGAAVCYFGTDIHSETLGVKPREDGETESLARCHDIKGEILMIFGTKDPHVPRKGRQMIYQALVDAGTDFSWIEMKADHAFIRDESSKGRYDPAVSKICFEALLEIFHRRLTLDMIDSNPKNPKDLIC